MELPRPPFANNQPESVPVQDPNNPVAGQPVPKLPVVVMSRAFPIKGRAEPVGPDHWDDVYLVLDPSSYEVVLTFAVLAMASAHEVRVIDGDGDLLFHMERDAQDFARVIGPPGLPTGPEEVAPGAAGKIEHMIERSTNSSPAHGMLRTGRKAHASLVVMEAKLQARANAKPRFGSFRTFRTVGNRVTGRIRSWWRNGMR